MGDPDRGSFPELDEVRRLLFPALTPEEGWARIDRALRGAANEEHWAAIEETVKQEQLGADLLTRLRQLREENQEYVAYRAGYRAATDAIWWESVDAAFRTSSMRSEFHASFVRGWEDGKATLTPPDGPAA